MEQNQENSHTSKMKEKFTEKISELLKNQAKNNKMLTEESYLNIIRKLKLLSDKPDRYQLKLDSKNDYSLPKLYEILVVEIEGVIKESLVKPVNGKKLRYVTVENMYEVLLHHHQKSGHGKSDIVYSDIK